MKFILSLFANNPLFLATSRERLRPTIFFSYLILALLICFLIQLEAGSKEHYFYHYDYTEYRAESYEPHKILILPAQQIILGITVLQHILLLLLGTLSAYSMAGRERTSGTLEFHRSSPYPRWKQAVGLLLGSASLEWCIFIATAIFQLVIALLNGINPVILLKFYPALISTTLLFHAGAVLAGIMKSENSKWGGPGIGVLIGIWIFGHLIFMNELSALYHLAWFPAYNALKSTLLDVPLHYVIGRGYNLHNNEIVLYSFFGVPLPSLLYQTVVQFPLIALIINAIIRRIRHPEHPLFSKAQFALLSFFILFLLLGSNTSNLLIGHYRYYYHQTADHLLTHFFYSAVIFGILGSLAVTPTRYVFTKGWRRAKKMHKKSPSADDDSSSNFSWLTTYLFIIFLIFSFYAQMLHLPLEKAGLVYLLLSAHILFFAEFYEFVQLSRWGRKRIIFGTAIIILWVIIPMFGEILKSAKIFQPLQTISLALSPFIGGFDLQKHLLTHDKTDTRFIVIGVAVVMAATASILALARRKQLIYEIQNDK